MKNRSNNGFSLVEVTLAIGLLAFALIGIVGLIPAGMKASRDAENDTRTSMIAQDAYNRIRARMTINNNPGSDYYFGAYPSGQASYFFYSDNGTPNGEVLNASASGAPGSPTDIPEVKNFYQAKVIVSQPVPTGTPFPAYDPRESTDPDLLCATVEIGWPVNESTGSVEGGQNASKSTHVFYLRKP